MLLCVRFFYIYNHVLYVSKAEPFSQFFKTVPLCRQHQSSEMELIHLGAVLPFSAAPGQAVGILGPPAASWSSARTNAV